MYSITTHQTVITKGTPTMELQERRNLLVIELTNAEQTLEEASKGPAKMAAGKAVKRLKAELAILDTDLETTEPEPETTEPEPETTEPEPETTEPKGDAEDGESVVVKNIGRFSLSDGELRFATGVEIPAVMSSFIRSQVKAKLFVLVGR